jgi:hypothetical protein
MVFSFGSGGTSWYFSIFLGDTQCFRDGEGVILAPSLQSDHGLRTLVYFCP